MSSERFAYVIGEGDDPGHEYSIWLDVNDPKGPFTITEGCEFSLIGASASAADLLRARYPRRGVVDTVARAHRIW